MLVGILSASMDKSPSQTHLRNEGDVLVRVRKAGSGMAEQRNSTVVFPLGFMQRQALDVS